MPLAPWEPVWPVGVALDRDNGLLVADAVENTLWRVAGPAGDS